MLQGLVPAKTWFGAYLEKPNTYALLGCTVAPGFDFEDFELGKKAELLELFPEHKEIIEKLSHT